MTLISGRKLIVEVTCRVLVTPPIISGKVWDKSQWLPLQGITWFGWASEQKTWVDVCSCSRRSRMEQFLSSLRRMWRTQTWNRSRLANECDVWGGVHLQNPIQTTLPPLLQFVFEQIYLHIYSVTYLSQTVAGLPSFSLIEFINDLNISQVTLLSPYLLTLSWDGPVILFLMHPELVSLSGTYFAV